MIKKADTYTKQHIDQYLAYKKLKMYDVDKLLGKAGGTWSKTRNPTAETLEKVFRKFPDLSAEWVLRDDGKMLRERFEPLHNVKKKAEDKKVQQIVLYDTKTFNGLETITGQIEGGMLGFIQLPNMPKCDGAICIHGDGMSPRIKAGDIVGFKVVAPQLDNIVWGEMYLVELSIGEENFIVPCTLTPSSRSEEYITLNSLNSAYPAKEIRLADAHALALIKFTLCLHTIG